MINKEATDCFAIASITFIFSIPQARQMLTSHACGPNTMAWDRLRRMYTRKFSSPRPFMKDFKIGYGRIEIPSAPGRFRLGYKQDDAVMN